jgi:hypothetical protein
LKKNNSYITDKFYHYLVVFLAAGLFTSGQAIAAQEKPKIVLLPFHIVASEKGDLIQKGIDSILSSRFSGELCEFEIKSSSSSDGDPSDRLIRNPSDGGLVCKELQGDFLIYGSFVKLGNTVTTDVFLYDSTQKKTTLHFTDLGKGDGALLDHLTEFTKKAEELLSPLCFNAKPQTPAKKSPPKSDRIIKSQDLKGVINGIAVGDFDNDRQIDIVTATDKSINILALDQNQFKEKVTITVPIKGYVVGVDAADINGNTIPEIFISVVTEDRMDAASIIIEWDGNAYKTIRSDLKWLFRTITMKGEKQPTIIAQKNKNLNSIMGSPIYRFSYGLGHSVEPPLTLPDGTFLYSIALSDGDKGSLADMKNNKLRIVNATKGLQWESDDVLGGSVTYMAKPDSADRDKINRVYLEPRLIFHDLDKDGTDELIAIKNNEATNHLFSGMKNFTKGRITIFSPSDFGYSIAHETDWVSGCITDFTLTDIDSDMVPELVYSIVSKGSFFSDKKSCLVIQKITEWYE